MESLLNFIASPNFPCVMAKSVASKGYLSHHRLSNADAAASASEILRKMHTFVDHFRADQKKLSSFVVTFDHPELHDFAKFENFFWNFLRELDVLDKKEHAPDARVSDDENSPQFSFSIKGEAFFMLVLHPESPRLARKFSEPTIVFNAHQQFEDLRAKGLFQKVRDLIRKRDKTLQGFINPMVQDFGTKSEVFQYTGREYPEESKCPFQRMKNRIQGQVKDWITT